MQRKGNSDTLAVGMQISTIIMENSMEFPQTTKNGTAIWSSNPTTANMSKGNELSTSMKYVYFHVNWVIVK